MSYQVLLVEGRTADAELIRESLRQSSVDCRVTHVPRLADALALQVNGRFDAVLLDLSLPDSSGLDSYVAMRSHAPALPLILLADSANQDVTIEAAKKGAQDYLLLDEISPAMLGKALLYSIERKRHEHALREQKDFYENLLLDASVWVEALDREGRTIFWNRGAEKLSGHAAATVMSNASRWELLYPDEAYRRERRMQFEALLDGDRGLRDVESEIRDGDGTGHIISWNASLIRGKAGEVVGCMLVGSDVTARRGSDRDIAESEQRFRTLAELTSDYVYAGEINAEGTVVAHWVEGAFERITGYDPLRVIGKPDAWIDIIHEEDRPPRSVFIEGLRAGPTTQEYRIRRSDGSVRWLRDRVRRVIDADGSGTARLLGAVTDITKEKEARKSETQAKRTLAALIHSSHDYAFLLDREGRILEAGPRIAAFFGMAPDDLVCRTIFDFIPDGYPEQHLLRLRALCASHEPMEYATEFAGHHIEIRATPVAGDTDDQGLVVVFGHDVTDARRAKDFLLGEQEKFRGIMENATDGIALMDGEGRFIEWNPSMERITGITREQALQSRHCDIQYLLTPAENRRGDLHAVFEDEMHKYLATGDAPWLDLLTERWIERPDGTRRRIEMVSFRIPSSSEMLTGSVTRDLTDIALTEEDIAEKNLLLATQNKELLERNEELDTFTHSVAHDLKNPLSLILGYADMVRQDAAALTASDVEDYMGSVMFNGRKMIAIINSLLLLASVRKEDVDVAPVDMEQVARDAVRRLQKQITDNQSVVSLPVAWFAPIGYAPWIEEVWVNYLGNAIKYGGMGCQVSIAAERQNDGMLRYALADDGPGIPHERIGELFVPFTRLAQANIEGHGLGLSIVKRIIEKLGGEVGVSSEVGKGSTFWFTLPEAAEDR